MLCCGNKQPKQISINLSKYYVSLHRGTGDPADISFLYSDPSVPTSQCKLLFFLNFHGKGRDSLKCHRAK